MSLEPVESGYALVMEDWGRVALGKYLQQQSLDLTEVLAIALNLLREGVSVATVVRSTGLSIEEVQQLQQQISESPQS